jgi:flavin reductase (DIM6/NTAB) family NADH-FMN oxidoreductase RutF
MSARAEADRYRAAIAHFPTGVAVVTSAGEAGPAGLTTNAVSSLSLEPLLMVVCLDRASRTLEVVRDSRRLAVNVLAADQHGLAHTFAGKASHAEKFRDVGWQEVDAVPVLDSVVAWFTGEVTELLPGGDHLIAVVAVASFDAAGGDPLVFHTSGYRALD